MSTLVDATKSHAVSAELAVLGHDPTPARPYYDEDYFNLEREAIFKKTWIQVGHICELPDIGSFIVRDIEIAQASILITRSKDGKLRAFHNVCTHRGTQLVADAEGTRNNFSCPYHMWTFGSDGRLLSAPDFQSFHIKSKSECDLVQVSIDTCAGLIFINLQAEPENTLSEFLGDMGTMIEDLPVSSAITMDEYTYEIDANWKVIFDNFQENYHLRFVHKRTNGAPAMDSTPNPFNYPVSYKAFGPHRMNTSPGGMPSDDPPKPLLFFFMERLAQQIQSDGLSEGVHDRDYFIFFPNLYLFGSPRMHFTHSIMPLSATKSRGIFRFYWSGEDTSANEKLVREFSTAFAREIHTEDAESLVRAQRGLNSGALKHVNFQAHEVLCRHLYHEVDARVKSYLAEKQGADA